MFGNRIGCRRPARPHLQRRCAPGCRLFLILLPVVALGAPASAQSPAQPLAGKADLFLQHTVSSGSLAGETQVIVRLDGGLTPEREAALQELGACIYRRLDLIASAAVRVPARDLPRLAALPFVTRLSADVQVHKNDAFTVGHSGAGAAYAQYGLTGAGVTVAVVDSGIHANADLLDPSTGRSRVLANVDFVPNASSTDDAFGHGTHVAGILAGDEIGR